MGRTNRPAARRAFLPAGAEAALRRRVSEAGGLLLIAAAVALVVALAGYSPDDPSLNTAAGTGGARNPLGLAGALVADVTLQSFGLAGVVPAAVLAAWGGRLLRHRGIAAPWLRVAALPLAVLFTAIAFAGIPAGSAWPLRAGYGGFVGDLLAARTLDWLAGFAALDLGLLAIFAAALAGVALVFALGYSAAEWRSAARAAGRVAIWLASRFRRSATEDEPVPERPARRRRGRVEPTLRKAGEQDAPEGPSRTKAPVVVPRTAKTTPGRRAEAARQRRFNLKGPEEAYELPPLDLLDDVPETEKSAQAVNEEALQQNARLLESVLEDFGVRGEIVKVRPGPVVTLYELEPAPGTKTSRVIGLSDDIARSMSAVSVRCAVIPGRNVIGIELPNARRETVYLRELLASEAYERATGRLPLVLGKDIGGAPVIADLARMPHLLVAGTTGSGKSVGLNAMILSLLYRLRPDTGKLIMIDPKMLELSIYEGIPHLLTPVVTDPKKAVVALKWTVKEMERRYRDMSKLGVRNIEGYNKRVGEAAAKGEVLTRKVQTGFDAETGRPVIEEQPLDLTPLPYIVVVVDELADLMLVSGKEIEAAIQRLAQMARAAGIHLIMATQRPSVDVVTGTIKANFPTRISFQVTSKVDSRTILGEQGAEQLLGQGDMLYMAGGGRITRVHGPLVHDDEVETVVRYLKSQGEPTYVEAVTEDDEESVLDVIGSGGDSGDELYERAVALVCEEGKASTSFVQRHLQIGYNRAARLIERMEKEGIIGPADHVGRREIIVGRRGRAAG